MPKHPRATVALGHQLDALGSELCSGDVCTALRGTIGPIGAYRPVPNVPPGAPDNVLSGSSSCEGVTMERGRAQRSKRRKEKQKMRRSSP